MSAKEKASSEQPTELVRQCKNECWKGHTNKSMTYKSSQGEQRRYLGICKYARNSKEVQHQITNKEK